MKKFDPLSMPATTSPTVRSLRAFVEKSIEDEVENVISEHGEQIADITEKALRSLAFNIFHKNPDVHVVAKKDMFAYDEAIQTLFAINSNLVEPEGSD